ncbi:MAG: carboxypeptidase regulatory-like domain-containing protein [Armatimonadetes bacterium]|nr:carboxypeptidase regulatory-like domain-containing protein [Armatimonadota bacterium]
MPADKGMITGSVQDMQGSGLIHAQVTLQNTALTATTTNFGTFEISGIAPGAYTVTASKGAQLSGKASEVVVEGGKVTPVQVVVSTAGSTGGLTGKVSSGTADLAGAAVTLTLPLDSNDPAKDAVFRRVSGANGSFAFADLPAATYRLSVAATGYRTDVRNATIQAGSVAGPLTVTLTDAAGSRPAVPGSLAIHAWTFPRSQTRSATAYRAIQAHWLRRYRPAMASAMQAGWSRQRTRSDQNSLVEVDLTWGRVNGADVCGYRVYRGKSEGGDYAQIADLPDPTRVSFIDYDPTLAPGTRSYYRVTAYSTNGQESSRSAAVSAAPMLQVSPFLPFDRSTDIIPNPTLQWNPVFTAQSYTVELYQAYPDAAIDPIWITDPPVSSALTRASYNGVPLEGGKTYYWVVGAHDHADPQQVTATAVSAIWRFTVKQ